METANADAAAFWAGMAPTWLELESRMEDVAGAPGVVAMDRLGLRPGDRVLDLGCGAGGTTIALAGRVAPGGTAVGVDIADEMLAAARQSARESGAAAEFVHADAQVHDLGAGTFDAAFSRFGVMFFADPVAAFYNVRRAMRPGGRLTFACWQSVFENEWMLIPGAAAMAVTGITPPMPGPDEPGPFAFENADRVRSILTEAGFQAIEVESRNDSVVTEEADIPALVDVNSRVGIVNELLRGADEETRVRVLDAIEDALRSRVQDGEVRASRGVHIVTAIA